MLHHRLLGVRWLTLGWRRGRASESTGSMGGRRGIDGPVKRVARGRLPQQNMWPEPSSSAYIHRRLGVGRAPRVTLDRRSRSRTRRGRSAGRERRRRSPSTPGGRRLRKGRAARAGRSARSLSENLAPAIDGRGARGYKVTKSDSLVCILFDGL